MNGAASSLTPNDFSVHQSLAMDAASLNRLKSIATSEGATPETIREAAKQFEALFMQELLKSMREASKALETGMFDSPAEDLSTSMLDQQYAILMSGRPGGLAEIMAKQLMRQLGIEDDKNANAAPDATAADPAAKTEAVPAAQIPDAARDFVRKHVSAAKEVEATSGLPASYMLGQAGHESGWGKRPILMSDGSDSHNLFGIKAGPEWKGKTAEITTTEYIGGEPRKVTARFRAYDSYADSYRDFARLVNNSPRYAEARAQIDGNAAHRSVQNWSRGLQEAGYATDPKYAEKLERAINTALLLQRRA